MHSNVQIKKLLALLLLSPLVVSEEDVKVIECEESGGLEIIKSGPDKGKKGSTHSGNFFWTIVDYEQNKIGYFNEIELRKYSRDEIVDFKFNIYGYQLKKEPEDLLGFLGDRKVINIDRTTLSVIHFGDKSGNTKHVFTKSCNLISRDELESRVLDEYLDFKNARKL